MSCMPARYNFNLYEATDCKILQTTTTEDLTGATIEFVAAKEVNSQSPLLTIAGVIDDAPAKKYHIPITAADTTNIVEGSSEKLHYDVFITLQSGEKVPDTYGVITLVSKVKE